MTSHWAQTAPGMRHDLGPGGQRQPGPFLRWPTATCCVPTAFQQPGGRACGPEGRRACHRVCYAAVGAAGLLCPAPQSGGRPGVPSFPQLSLAPEHHRRWQSLLGHQPGRTPPTPTATLALSTPVETVGTSGWRARVFLPFAHEDGPPAPVLAGSPWGFLVTTQRKPEVFGIRQTWPAAQ